MENDERGDLEIDVRTDPNLDNLERLTAEPQRTLSKRREFFLDLLLSNQFSLCVSSALSAALRLSLTLSNPLRSKKNFI